MRMAKPKFQLRQVVRLNGIQHTVEQVAEDPKAEPRYWLQRGKNFEDRVWAREHEIEDTRTLQEQFQREQIAQRISTRPVKSVPVSTEKSVS